MTLKDALDVVIIPVVVVLLGFFWPAIQARYRCGRFKQLARRELEEVGPYPEKREGQQSWKDHLKKDFVHRKIIQQPSENRDFLLGLSPEFVYWLAQLWSSYDTDQPDQWLHYLKKLATHKYTTSTDLQKALAKWEQLCKSYSVAP